MSARLRLRRTLALVAAAVIPTGCAGPDPVDTELMLLELQAYNAELETQLEYLYTEVDRISGAVSAGVRNLEAAMEDVHLRVLDLPSADLAVTMREVEAAVAIANGRVAELKVAADDLARTVEY